MELFTEQQIEYYRQFFDLPDVVNTANKIEEVVKSVDKMNQTEAFASFALAYVRLSKYFNNKTTNM